eukprot:2880342-Rhodomonas_salina.3
MPDTHPERPLPVYLHTPAPRDRACPHRRNLPAARIDLHLLRQLPAGPHSVSEPVCHVSTHADLSGERIAVEDDNVRAVGRAVDAQLEGGRVEGRRPSQHLHGLLSDHLRVRPVLVLARGVWLYGVRHREEVFAGAVRAGGVACERRQAPDPRLGCLSAEVSAPLGCDLIVADDELDAPRQLLQMTTTESSSPAVTVALATTTLLREQHSRGVSFLKSEEMPPG